MRGSSRNHCRSIQPFAARCPSADAAAESLRFESLAFRWWELIAYFAQPVSEANDFGHFEVMSRRDEVIRVVLSHALTARPHQPSRGEIACDQRPTSEHQSIALFCRC